MFRRIIGKIVGKRVDYDFYVGGPMRGYKDLNKPMFSFVAHMLRLKGFKIWSPAEHESYIKLSFAQCMNVDLNFVINSCRQVALLPGWRDSLGANMEVFSAFACGKQIFEVMFNENKTDFDLVPFDASMYRLPYKTGVSRQFDPHVCEIDSFQEKPNN